MGVRAQNPVVSEEECIVNAENAAEAEACKDPPLKRVVKMPNSEIDGYAESGAKRPGAPNPDCRRGTHGLARSSISFDICTISTSFADELTFGDRALNYVVSRVVERVPPCRRAHRPVRTTG